MGQNLTLKNGENGNLLNNDTFSWYTGTNNGYVKLNIALSDMDLSAHTVKITTNWSWHGGGNEWCWDYDTGSEYYKLYTTGTSSSSGTSKTYYLYTGGNKHSYPSGSGGPTTGSTYFNWAAAHSAGSSTYADINDQVNKKTVNNTVTVNLASDNSLSMSIATKLTTTTSSGYGPRSDKTWTTYILTINSSGAFMWVNDNGTWKQGLVYVNDNGTWKPGNVSYVNDGGTWKTQS